MCSKDKSTYVARFSLAPYITKILLVDIIKDMFVLMMMKVSMKLHKLNNWTCMSAIENNITSSPGSWSHSSYYMRQVKIDRTILK